MRRLSRCFCLGLALCLGAAAGAATKPPAALSPGQYFLLRAARAPLVLPAYVPPGFRAVDVRPDGANTYTIRYADAAHRSFDWVVTYSGFGGGDPDPNSLDIPQRVRSVHMDHLDSDAYLEHFASPSCYRGSNFSKPHGLDIEVSISNCGSLLDLGEVARVFGSANVFAR